MLMAATATAMTAPVMGIVAAVTVPAPLVVLLVGATAIGVWAAMMWLRIKAGRRRLHQEAEILRHAHQHDDLVGAVRMAVHEPFAVENLDEESATEKLEAVLQAA